MGETGPLSWGMKSPTKAAGPHDQRPWRIVFRSSLGVSCIPTLNLHLPQSHRGLASSHRLLGMVNLRVYTTGKTTLSHQTTTSGHFLCP